MKVAQIKLLRRALVALIVVVIAAVAWNYVQTWRRRAHVVQQAAKILSTEMLRSADSIEYSASSSGVLHFKLRAQRLLETRQGINLLEGIDAYDYNPDGSPKNHIQSQKAEYDREQRKADFYGDVRIHSGTDLELRTNSLHYDLEKSSGKTDDPLSLSSGQVRGSATGARYDRGEGILALHSNLDFIIRRKLPGSEGTPQFENMRVRAGRGEFSESGHTINLRGSVHIDSESASLSGDEVVAAFSPDKKHLTSLQCSGNAEYVSRDAAGSRSLQGERMIFGISPASSSLEKIDVFQRALFSLAAPDSEQTLSGAEMHVSMDPARGLLTGLEAGGGVVFKIKRNLDQQLVQGQNLAATFLPGSNMIQQMRVWGGAKMTSRSAGGASDELSAQEIRLGFSATGDRSVLKELQAEKSVSLVSSPRRAADSKPAQPGRTLSASFLRMLYSASGEYAESGQATGQVTISGITSGDSSQVEIRRLKADNVHFEFFPRSSQLRSFDGTDHVEIIYHKPAAKPGEAKAEEFRTSSSNVRAVFRESDGKAESVRQWGDFVYKDDSRTATAATSDYDALKDLLLLRGSPKIVDGQATTTGELVQYDQAQKILSASGGVRSVLKSQDSGQMTPFGSSSNAPSPSVVISDRMQVWTETSQVRYSGKVQMLSENSQLSSKSLEIGEGGARVDAEGDIRHLLTRKEDQGQKKGLVESRPEAGSRKKREAGSSPVLVESAHLTYRKDLNSIRYTGNVILQSDDTRMNSDMLDVTFGSDGKIQRASAQGRLQIRQGGRDVRGEKGDYDLALGQFVVTGNPAEISDPERGKSAALRLTFFTADDRILLGH